MTSLKQITDCMDRLSIAQEKSQRLGMTYDVPSIKEANSEYDEIYQQILIMARKCGPIILRRAWKYCDNILLARDIQEIAFDRGIHVP